MYLKILLLLEKVKSFIREDSNSSLALLIVCCKEFSAAVNFILLIKCNFITVHIVKLECWIVNSLMPACSHTNIGTFSYIVSITQCWNYKPRLNFLHAAIFPSYVNIANYFLQFYCN